MEREIPRNVRQIGNISGGPKIYVEDYVDTFFGQISDQTEEIRGAFLIGEMEGGEHPDYIYITGAIQMYELKRDGNTFQITEETWKNAYEDCKRYFGNATIVGWFVSAPGLPAEINDEMIRTHETAFPDTYSVFVMRDLREKEDYFYGQGSQKFPQPDSHEGGVRRSKTVNSFYAYRQFVFDLSHAGDGDNDDE